MESLCALIMGSRKAAPAPAQIASSSMHASGVLDLIRIGNAQQSSGQRKQMQSDYLPQKIAWGGEASSFFGEASEEESLSVENDVGFAKPDVGSGVWGHGAPRGARFATEWLRRDLNQEADDLTNGVYGQFSLEKRLRFDLSDFEGIIFMMAAGGDLYGEIAASKPESCRGPCKKQKKADGLRFTDPWQKHNAKAGGNKYKKENAPGGRSPRWGGCLSCPLLHVLG